MLKSCFVLCFLVLVVAIRNGNSDTNESDCPRGCKGDEYECIDGDCYCASGYVPNFYYNRCIRCPKENERCFGICCNENNSYNASLTCWQGVCRYCTDEDNNWICSDAYDNVFLISSAQIAMAAALIMCILAMFMLMCKLCAVPSISPYGASGSSTNSRLSVGSLQLYIEERLRDAPPRYSRAPAPVPAIVPATIYLNAGFIHDSSVPPPPYTPQKEESENTTLHI